VILARAVLCVGLIVLAGCAPPPRSSFEACLADTRAFRFRDARRGGFHERLRFNWADWGRDNVYSDGRLDVVESIERCEHFVTVKQGARTWRSRGYKRIEHFVTDIHGRRWAFEGHGDHVFVVVDGVEGPPFREVGWMPTFSLNGEHVAYLAKEDQGGVVMVDGRTALRAPDVKANNFAVLDDGRVAAVVSAPGGKWRVAFGDQVSPAFDDIVELSFTVSEAKGRLGFVGVRGAEYVAVIDGRVIEAPGVVLRRSITFSNDGDHVAYGTCVRGEKPGKDRCFAVWDGRVIPLGDGADVVQFLGAYPVFSTSGAPEETHYVILGLPTPAVEASYDEYQREGMHSRRTSRVRIGDSLGPRFDDLKPGSLQILPDGRVRYVGIREGGEIEVIDNRMPQGAKPAQVAQ